MSNVLDQLQSVSNIKAQAIQVGVNFNLKQFVAMR